MRSAVTTLDFPSVTVDFLFRDDGLIFPCKWTSRSEIYTNRISIGIITARYISYPAEII